MNSAITKFINKKFIFKNTMLSKRGLSPLIATTLLVALAVALGASFVTYAGALFEKRSAGKTECSDYLVNFFEVDSTKNSCTSQIGNPIALKFNQDNKKDMPTSCYVNIASGTSRICNKKVLYINNTWVPSNFKI